MGCCNTTHVQINSELMTELEVEYNEEVEFQLSCRSAGTKKIKKLLLLGSGSSGKSTLFRQLKCLYSQGFQAEDIEDAVPIIRKNCVSGILKLLKETQHLFEIDQKENCDCFINLQKMDDTIMNAINTVVNYANETFEMFGVQCISDIDEKSMKKSEIKQIYKTMKLQMLELQLAINLLWNMNEIQLTFYKRRKFMYSFPDNMQYFFEVHLH